jgi:hypothetical protein
VALNTKNQSINPSNNNSWGPWWSYSYSKDKQYNGQRKKDDGHKTLHIKVTLSNRNSRELSDRQNDNSSKLTMLCYYNNQDRLSLGRDKSCCVIIMIKTDYLWVETSPAVLLQWSRQIWLSLCRDKSCCVITMIKTDYLWVEKSPAVLLQWSRHIIFG